MAKIHVHFLGIGGSGASAAAKIAEAQGFEVSGCDLNPDNEFTTSFKKSQLLNKGHSPNHLRLHLKGEGIKVDILAVTPAITSLDPNNEELQEARKRGIEILTWQQFLGKYLTKDKFVIAVSGTHGKTTTTAMIAKILENGGLDPTVLLGAIVPKWGTNYRIPTRHSERSEESQDSKSRDLSLIARDDKKEFFIVEADEFNDNFLTIKPDISVVTNIEMDHPEYFKDFKAYKKSFKKFLKSTKQTIIANLSDSGVQQTLNAQTGFGNSIIDYSKHLINSSLLIPGEFNRWNASAAFQVGLLLGIDPFVIQKNLSSYSGIGRRFEYLGRYKGREVYSDFGHHPTEIKETMQAAREKFPDQYIWLIYQPHMFSRTKALFKQFVEVFKQIPVNQALILDIYPSREVDTGLVSSQELADAIDDHKVDYISGIEELKEIINKEIRPGDIIFFMGAGDIDQFARELVHKP